LFWREAYYARCHNAHTDKEERLQELVVLFVLLLFFTRGILVSKMTNFLLSQHLFDDDVVELVPSLYA